LSEVVEDLLAPQPRDAVTDVHGEVHGPRGHDRAAGVEQAAGSVRASGVHEERIPGRQFRFNDFLLDFYALFAVQEPRQGAVR